MQARVIQISNVKVCVRVRPFLPREILNNDPEAITNQNDYSIEVGHQSYRFDRVFDQNSTQEEIYNSQIKLLVQGFFRGYNSTLLAYGQTGSGKTYTMGTSGIQSEGIIQLVINDIFKIMEENKNQVRYNVKVSFIEVYNQEVYDLLNQNMRRTSIFSLPIRENIDKSISVVGVKQEITVDKEDVLKMLSQGNCKRCTASNGINNLSSRSHAIFTISVSQLPQKDCVTDCVQQSAEIRSKFHFVDLAGSERLKKTKAQGATLNQGININIGLLHLGQVIKALASTKTSKLHVPYRNSKLTRLLQDSLGGNSNTQMIACISPSSSSFEQTINTLKYAERAMNIQNKPIINRDPSSNQILLLKNRILELEEENNQFRGGQYFGMRKVSKLDFRETQQYKTIVDKCQAQVESLESQLKEYQAKNNQLQIDYLNIKTKRDQILLYLNENSFRIEIPKEFKIDVLEEYKEKISQLEEDVKIKQKRIFDLEKELGHYLICFKRDDDILITKLQQIEFLKKEIGVLDKHNHDQIYYDDENTAQIILSEEQESGMVDQQFQRQKIDFTTRSEHLSYEIGEVEELIINREKMLKDLNNSQILVQNQLIELMKEQHGAKIKQFEAEKDKLENDLKIAINNQSKNTVNALQMKKLQLEQKLKLCNKKIKEQERLEKAIKQKESRINKLKADINKSKMDKIQMGRKLKEQRQAFQKYKQMKGRDIINLNRMKNAKDKEINRLNFTNHQKDIALMRTKQANLRLKREKQNLIKFKRGQKKKAVTIPAQRQPTNESKMAESIINKIYENIINDKNAQNIKDELQKCILDANDLDEQYNKKSLQILRLEHEGVFKFVEEINQQMRELKETLEILEKKEMHLRNLLAVETTKTKFNYEAQVIYNVKFDNTGIVRSLFLEILRQVENVLIQKHFQQGRINQFIIDNEFLQEKVKQLNSNLFFQQQVHKQNLQSLRKQLAVRNQQYENLMSKAMMSKDQTKKELEIANKQLREQMQNNQKLRKRNEILLEKNQGLRKLNDKDKYIGINNRQDGIPKINTFREKRIQKSLDINRSRSNSNAHSRSILSNQRKFSSNIDNVSVGSGSSLIYQNFDELDDFTVRQKQSEKLICMNEIPAHDSAINHLELSGNVLISTATKSLKIWDVQQLKFLHEIIKFNTIVKTVALTPENDIMIAGSGNSLSTWDMRNYGQLRSFKFSEQTAIKAIKIHQNYIFIGTNYGIQTMDLRSGSLFEQKDKKEDIFAMTMYDDILLYGGRNHHVKMLQPNMEIKILNPPHYGIVSSLAILDEYILSGSLDKSIKLWKLNQYNEIIQKSKIVTHSSVVNTMCTDPYNSLIFSGARNGSVKIITVDREKDKLEVLGQTNCHTEAINAMICKSRTLMTGSSDKTIKIWKTEKDNR